jgi:ribose transport system permease protein
MEKVKINKSNKLSNTFRKMYTSTPGAVLLVTILITVAVQIGTHNFYSAYNITTLIREVAFTIIVAFGQTLVLLLGGIDLSVASIAGISSMTVAMLLTSTSINHILCIVIALVIGLLLGAVNGVLICTLRLTPFIVTLATGGVYLGIIYVITKGNPIIGIPADVGAIGQGVLFGVLPYPTIIMIVIFVLLLVMLHYTSFGRHIYAIGGNEQAASIVGIRVKMTKLLVYSLSGLLASIAGVLMVLRLACSQVNIGQNWVMPSITAAILGGTSMSGGVGSIVGTIVGGLLMGVISFSITLTGISSYWENVVTGAVILVAVAVDAIRLINKDK